MACLEVEVVVRARVPGQLGDPFEVGADDLRLHRLAARALEPAELALDLGARLLGELELGELLAELGQLSRLLVVVAELLLDRLDLLAEVHLALALAQLLLHLRLDLVLRLEHADLRAGRGRARAGAAPRPPGSRAGPASRRRGARCSRPRGRRSGRARSRRRGPGAGPPRASPASRPAPWHARGSPCRAPRRRCRARRPAPSRPSAASRP